MAFDPAYCLLYAEPMWDLRIMSLQSGTFRNMPSGSYYRRQAQVFARLAIATSDPRITERYNQMALEQLARAEDVEPTAGKLSAKPTNV